MAKKKFYAVKNGKTPGIYLNWDDCKAQVDGYPGAKYKSFSSAAEAQIYLEEPEETKGSVSVQKSVPEVSLPDGPYAFVDGSFNPDTGVYGYGGFLCASGKRYPLTGSGHDQEMSKMRNVSGEISGAMAAVRKAEELHIREMTILYDYKGIEEWAKGTWKCNTVGTSDYQKFMNDDNRRVSVNFQKVPAHTGIEGNEMADVMAKNAVGIALTGPQRDLLMKALTYGQRNGVSSVDDKINEFGNTGISL